MMPALALARVVPLLAVLSPVVALAECPPARDIADEQAALYTELQAVPTFAAARPYTDRLWRLWTEAPDAAAQDLLDAGMMARDSFDFDRAVVAFDALIAYCPAYAEGYNQRAFVSFLRDDFAAALADLEAALDINPDHVAALAGLGLTLMRLGRPEAAQAVLRRAVRLHPWLPERALLDQPAGDTGSDL